MISINKILIFLTMQVFDLNCLHKTYDSKKFNKNDYLSKKFCYVISRCITANNITHILYSRLSINDYDEHTLMMHILLIS